MIPGRIFGIKTADIMSAARMILAFASGYLILNGSRSLSAIVLAVAFISDLDGRIARLTGTDSAKGKILDNLADASAIAVPTLSLWVSGIMGSMEFMFWLVSSAISAISFTSSIGMENSTAIEKLGGASNYLYIFMYLLAPEFARPALYASLLFNSSVSIWALMKNLNARKKKS